MIYNNYMRLTVIFRNVIPSISCFGVKVTSLLIIEILYLSVKILGGTRFVIVGQTGKCTCGHENTFHQKRTVCRVVVGKGGPITSEPYFSICSCKKDVLTNCQVHTSRKD
jgi:hypothetical protein